MEFAFTFDADLTAENIDTSRAASGAGFTDLTPSVRKRVIWAGQPAVKTPLAAAYLHGFSAISQEIRPVTTVIPDWISDLR